MISGKLDASALALLANSGPVAQGKEPSESGDTQSAMVSNSSDSGGPETTADGNPKPSQGDNADE